MALLRMEQAAVKLGISYGQLRSLIAEGDLKVTRVGARSIRISEEEIVKHLERRNK